jgi:polar amino acid transport system substrate-binding protein
MRLTDLSIAFFLPHSGSWRALAGLLLLPAFALSPAHAAKPLNFCFENEHVRPWRTVEGTGLNFLLLKQVSASINTPFSYAGRPWKRCLLELKENRVDGAIGASFKADRLEFGVYPTLPGSSEINVAESLYVERYVVLRRKGTKLSWDGQVFRDDGKPLFKPVGAQLGYSVVDNLKAIGVAVDDSGHSAHDVLKKLQFSRIEAAVMLSGEARQLLDDVEGFRDSLEILPTPLVEKHYFLMLSRGLVAKQPELARSVWAGIARARASSAYQLEERKVLGAGGGQAPRR